MRTPLRLKVVERVRAAPIVRVVAFVAADRVVIDGRRSTEKHPDSAGAGTDTAGCALDGVVVDLPGRAVVDDEDRGSLVAGQGGVVDGEVADLRIGRELTAADLGAGTDAEAVVTVVARRVVADVADRRPRDRERRSVDDGDPPVDAVAGSRAGAGNSQVAHPNVRAAVDLDDVQEPVAVRHEYGRRGDRARSGACPSQGQILRDRHLLDVAAPGKRDRVAGRGDVDRLLDVLARAVPAAGRVVHARR